VTRLLLVLALAACAEPPQPRLWTVQETHERFDGIELRLVRGAKRVNAWRSFAEFTRWRATARRERRVVMLARNDGVPR
jgi:hypothetical protein